MLTDAEKEEVTKLGLGLAKIYTAARPSPKREALRRAVESLITAVSGPSAPAGRPDPRKVQADWEQAGRAARGERY
jgi:hypothetical protein